MSGGMQALVKSSALCFTYVICQLLRGGWDRDKITTFKLYGYGMYM